MSLILPSQRLIRPNPLAYPAGAKPGVDPNHVASRNLGFSVVRGAGAQFVNLTSGVPTSYVGSFAAPIAKIDSALGPSICWPNITDKGVKIANAGSVVTPFAATMAVMVRGLTTVGGQNYFPMIITDTETNFLYLHDATGATLTPDIITSGHNHASFTLAVGAPYLLIYSGSLVNGGTGFFLAKNLNTGQILQSIITIVGTYVGTSATNFNIGSDSTGTDGANANIAAAMYSANLALPLWQMRQWAEDPWSFWYPCPTREYVIPPAAATIQFGWEPQLPLLPHLFYERRGAIARGDDGSETTKINWFNGGWEIQPPPPPHQPREKRGAILPRDDGNELPKINWFNAGWETQPPPPPHPKVESRGAIMPRDDGNQLPKINWFNGGWEVQPPPPATANRRNARSAILRGDDGTEGVYSSVVILTSGWGFDPNLPLVLRPKRLDASLIGDFGNQSPFILFQPSGFEIAPFQPPHPRSERSGSLMRGDDGVQAGQINFFPAGFEAVWHQPNHPRPERSGVMALGDIGYYAPTATVVTSNWGFDAPLWQPPRQIYRAATLPWGDDGIQSQFILFRPTGFEISPVQPPHPRFEQRAAGFLRGDDGNQDILRSWFNAGWEVAPYQPQHVAYAKAGAIMFGDDGTESVYVFIAPAVGTSTWRTLMGVGI